MNTIEEAIEDIKNGKIVLVIDDPDRENEGDCICAAEFATPANVNFMATYAKGLICMPMSRELTEKQNQGAIFRYIWLMQYLGFEYICHHMEFSL